MATPSPQRVPVGHLVRAPKTAELIASQLRRQIVRGDLRAGDTLPSELALMEQFGVSRPTLREAFRILETESLISVRRGSRGGAKVVEPDIAVATRYVGLLLQVAGTTIADVYEARTLIDPVAARLLAQRRTRKDIDDLNAAIDELVTVVEGAERFREPAMWTEPTFKFHDLVLERAGNKTLALQAGVLREVVEIHLSTAVGRTLNTSALPDVFRKTVRSYRKLVSLLEAKDADGAERHWRTHMEVAARRLLRDDFASKTVVDLFG